MVTLLRKVYICRSTFRVLSSATSTVSTLPFQIKLHTVEKGLTNFKRVNTGRLPNVLVWRPTR